MQAMEQETLGIVAQRLERDERSNNENDNQKKAETKKNYGKKELRKKRAHLMRCEIVQLPAILPKMQSAPGRRAIEGDER
jgi:hypothetical protein